MRIGLVCPYSFDVPGGVQFHIRDLAQELIARRHEVSVLAPAEETTPVPDYVVPTGRTVPIHYNGSVARLSFGPVTAARTRRWVAEGNFDLLHVHEPITPSVSMLALINAQGPIVATFHSSQLRSRALKAAFPLVRAALEKLVGVIAVSEDARRTVVDHLGTDAIIIPNGVYVDHFQGPADPRWQGTKEQPVIAFLGRLDEPRKGLAVLEGAIGPVLETFPEARFVVAGNGDAAASAARLGDQARAVEYLGPISEPDKVALLSHCSAYVAPQTGGESFGIVLVEAMSAGAPVVASDLGAFSRVADAGALARLFPVGDSIGLAEALIDTLTQVEQTDAMRRAAQVAAHRYDWSVVTDSILTLYDVATSSGAGAVKAAPRRETWGRI
ncbi:MAG: glycosyltransferase family 4 protein [Micrococcales bacterium]|nr:glycosyltransferase family 4 protein [Micrococcales bacterium]